MSRAVIAGVRIAAAHNGAAELVVILRHGNGATSEISLDEMAAAALLRACNAATTDELPGAGWEKVREALGVSWNRYNDNRG